MGVLTSSGFIDYNPANVPRNLIHAYVPEVAHGMGFDAPLGVELMEPGMATGFMVNYE